METKKLLSIIIPTYNREEKVVKQVRDLLPQLTEEVNLIVIDNCSPFNIYEDFTKEEKSKFEIIKNLYNIGGDGNIAKCFSICETDWLWTLSDDDQITQNAVGIVIKRIKENRDTLYLNFNYDSDVIIKGIEEFCQNSTNKYSRLFWMSVCVYNVRLLSSFLPDYFRALSTMQPGVVLLSKALNDNKESVICFYADQIIKSGNVEVGWNRENFIYSTLILFDKLRFIPKVHRKKLFDAIYDMCLENIEVYRRSKASMSLGLRILHDVTTRYDFYNSYIRRFIRTLHCTFIIVFPNIRIRR